MESLTRRQWLQRSSAAGLLAVTGCGASTRRVEPSFQEHRAGGEAGLERDWAWSAAEAARLGDDRDELELVYWGHANDAILRRKARRVPPWVDLTALARRMERTMTRLEGVGLAGPQVGMALRVATLLLDYKTERPRMVFVRNPFIVARSREVTDSYEMCLSIPGVGGLVRRSRWVRVEHSGPDDEPLSEEAEGPNAILWQHELDHLDGILYVAKLQGELLPADEVRRRRELAEAAAATAAAR